MSLRQQCRSMSGMTWPDGKALLDQPYRLMLAFSVIGEIEALCMKDKSR